MNDELKEVALAIDALNYSEMLEFAAGVGDFLETHNEELGLADALATWSSGLGKAPGEAEAEPTSAVQFHRTFFHIINDLVDMGPHIIGIVDHDLSGGAKGFYTTQPDGDRDKFAELISDARRDFAKFCAEHIDNEQEDEM